MLLAAQRERELLEVERQRLYGRNTAESTGSLTRAGSLNEADEDDLPLAAGEAGDKAEMSHIEYRTAGKRGDRGVSRLFSWLANRF